MGEPPGGLRGAGRAATIPRTAADGRPFSGGGRRVSRMPPRVLTDERVAEINERIRQGGFAARLASLFGNDSARTSEVSYGVFDRELAAYVSSLLKNISGLGDLRHVAGIPASGPKSYGGCAHLSATGHLRVRRAAPRFMTTDVEVWEMRPAWGLRALFFPDALLLFRRNKYEAVPYEDVAVSGGAVRFAGHGHDRLAEVVEHTWVHTNLGGGPDRRYSQNSMAPVARYHLVTLESSAAGLRLSLLIPQEEAARVLREAFRKAFAVASSRGGAPGGNRGSSGGSSGGSSRGGAREGDGRGDRDRGGRQPRDSERPASPSAWKVLEVDPDASEGEILAAYRKMARMYHPVRVEGLGPEFKELAEKRMKEINAAYQELKRLVDG